MCVWSDVRRASQLKCTYFKVLHTMPLALFSRLRACGALFLRVRDTSTLETYALKVKITQGTRSHYT